MSAQPIYTHRQITYRLRPGSRDKATKLFQQAGACRKVWNETLAKNQEQMELHRENPEEFEKPSTSFMSMGVGFTKLRKELDWLQDYSASITRYTLKYQADAWRACFRSGAYKNGQGFPKFKSKYGSDPSFTIPENVKIENNKIYIQKLGYYNFYGNNPYPEGKPVAAFVKYKAGKWWLTVCYKIVEPQKTTNGITCGIDRNVRDVCLVDSQGNKEIIYIPDTKSKIAKTKRIQRRMARQIKGSNRYKKTQTCYRKHNKHLSDIRNNWQHQVSRKIANNNEVVVLEKLNTKGMSRSAKGTVEKPGKMVKQKSGLNRSILNAGWYGLEQKLKYKCNTVIFINPAYTSQACSACGTIDKKSRDGDSYLCVHCGHKEHSGLNAARNIMASGIGVSARGGETLDSKVTPLFKREKIYKKIA